MNPPREPIFTPAFLPGFTAPVSISLLTSIARRLVLELAGADGETIDHMLHRAQQARSFLAQIVDTFGALGPIALATASENNR